MSFIKNFTETHGILLPGRVLGGRDYEKAKLLPSSMSKCYVYSMYKESCDGRVVSESSFKTARKLYVPHIYIMKPMTDLCWTCRRNSRAVVRILVVQWKEYLRYIQDYGRKSLTLIITGNLESERAY